MRRSARLRERREAEVVVEIDETTVEAYGKLVKLEESCVEMGVVDDRSEGEVDSVKVEENDEL